MLLDLFDKYFDELIGYVLDGLIDGEGLDSSSGACVVELGDGTVELSFFFALLLVSAALSKFPIEPSRSVAIDGRNFGPPIV